MGICIFNIQGRIPVMSVGLPKQYYLENISLHYALGYHPLKISVTSPNLAIFQCDGKFIMLIAAPPRSIQAVSTHLPRSYLPFRGAIRASVRSARISGNGTVLDMISYIHKLGRAQVIIGFSDIFQRDNRAQLLTRFPRLIDLHRSINPLIGQDIFGAFSLRNSWKG